MSFGYATFCQAAVFKNQIPSVLPDIKVIFNLPEGMSSAGKDQWFALLASVRVYLTNLMSDKVRPRPLIIRGQDYSLFLLSNVQ